jgi:hypothetical protein|tara:strand:+ start:115 stop:363 length:249 start_codon:yes stop_codon:yes gene_type:complete
MKVKYKRVDSLAHGEVKEIQLIGEDQEQEKGKHYFVFWLNHKNESRSTRVSHKELFDWFKIDQAEFDKKFMKASDLDEKLAK